MREHGRYYTYTRGCRCDPCREAGTEHHRQWRARKRQEIQLNAIPADWFTYIPEGDTTWMTRAACRSADTAMFFPGRGENVNANKAKEICATCEVQSACLAYAIRTGQMVGIWGGQSGRTLRALRNEYLQGNVA
jgi:hypothetical protein